MEKNKYITIRTNKVSAKFYTNDTYSKRWFFPRYQHGRIHEKNIIHHLADRIQKSKTFIDIGAHIGYYSCLMSKTNPNTKIYTIEMDENCIPIIKRNAVLNEAHNIAIINCAIADENKNVYISDLQQPNPELSLINLTSRLASQRQIACYRLDTLMSSIDLKLTIIKIDVEGSELDVLYGMRKLMEINKPKLYIELHPEKTKFTYRTPENVINFLKKHGYRVFFFKSFRNQKIIPPKSYDSRNQMFDNNCFIYCECL